MKIYAIILSIAVMLLLKSSVSFSITSTANSAADSTLSLDRSTIELQLGRPLKLKERIALKRLKRKKEKANNPKDGQSLAIVGVVLGVLALAGGGYLLGIPATIFSAISLRRMRKSGERKFHPFASAGLVAGLLALLVIGVRIAILLFFC